MSQAEKARAFAALHVKGDPVILYNIWDAGSAKAVAEAGAAALATGSLSVAAAQGFSDGQAIPLSLLETIVQRIVATVDLPLTVDFEGGYASDTETLVQNTARIIAAGAIGVNFEDQVVGGEGLYPIDEQARRVAAVRQAAESSGVPLVINARTDLFLKEKDRARHGDLLPEAIQRAQAYKEAGADSAFLPGLADPELVRTACREIALPVNIMALPGAPSLSELAELGVGRVSFGPFPYWEAMKALTERAKAVLGT